MPILLELSKVGKSWDEFFDASKYNQGDWDRKNKNRKNWAKKDGKL